MKTKKTQPYIDYDKAAFLTRLYDFINRANQMREDVYTQLDYMDHLFGMMKEQISFMKQAFAPVGNPNDRVTFYEHDIEALRSYAWSAGLTKTLWEKLKDQNFRHRFSGFINTPVQKDEIEDPPIFDKNGEFLIPPKNTKPA
ncbi:hypothetical protein, partial [Treponema sp. R80B11-R83G3]